MKSESAYSVPFYHPAFWTEPTELEFQTRAFEIHPKDRKSLLQEIMSPRLDLISGTGIIEQQVSNYLMAAYPPLEPEIVNAGPYSVTISNTVLGDFEEDDNHEADSIVSFPELPFRPSHCDRNEHPLALRSRCAGLGPLNDDVYTSRKAPRHIIRRTTGSIDKSVGSRRVVSSLVSNELHPCIDSIINSHLEKMELQCECSECGSMLLYDNGADKYVSNAQLFQPVKAHNEKSSDRFSHISTGASENQEGQNLQVADDKKSKHKGQRYAFRRNFQLVVIRIATAAGQTGEAFNRLKSGLTKNQTRK